MKNFAVSWSKLSTFETCPWKFWLLYGSKHVKGKAIIPFQSSKALEDGNTKHELMEEALRNIKRGFPVGMHVEADPFWQPWWGELVEKLVKEFPKSWVEQKLAADIDYKKVALDKYWQPSMTNQEVFFQGRLDAVFFKCRPFSREAPADYARIIDWKSGKVRETEGYQQLASQALLLFTALPALETIDAYYVFLDHKKMRVEKFSRKKDFKLLKREFDERIIGGITKAFKFNSFPAEPRINWACKWCPAGEEDCHKSQQHKF